MNAATTAGGALAPIGRMRRAAAALPWAELVVACSVTIYLAVTLSRLADFPPVYIDEPWIAAAGYKLATQGVFGTDLYTGYYHSEQLNVWYPPVLPLLEAASFELLGIGLIQIRIISALFGALLIVAAYLVGSRLADRRTGALAALLLIFLRLGTGRPEQPTGILLLDFARYARPDVLAAALGFLALWTFTRAEERRRGSLYVASGALVALATLSHLYGFFWLPSLWLVALVRHGRGWVARDRVLGPLAGLTLVCAPWVVVVATHWQDYAGQMGIAAPRFRVLDPRFYVSNILLEIDRYRFLDWRDPDGNLYLARPGQWVAVLGVPSALVLLARGWLRGERNTAFALALVFVLQVTLFAVLILAKFHFYTIVTWPLALLLLAWLGMWLWDGIGARPARIGLAVILLLVLGEGVTRIRHQRVLAERVTPYERFESRLAAHIPHGARTLGPMYFWLGLHEYSYRAWFLPHFLSDSSLHHDPLPFREALERVAPDVVLLDERVGLWVTQQPDLDGSNRRSAFESYMTDHQAELVAIVADSTYGRVEIYWLEGAAGQVSAGGPR